MIVFHMQLKNGKVLNENVTSWIHESDEENLNLEASTSDNPSNKTDLINGPRGGYQEPQRTSSANTSAIDNSVVFNQAEGIMRVISDKAPHKMQVWLEERMKNRKVCGEELPGMLQVRQASRHRAQHLNVLLQRVLRHRQDCEAQAR